MLKLVEAIEPCIWVPRELAQNVTRPAVSTGQVTNSDVNHVMRTTPTASVFREVEE